MVEWQDEMNRVELAIVTMSLLTRDRGSNGTDYDI